MQRSNNKYGVSFTNLKLSRVVQVSERYQNMMKIKFTKKKKSPEEHFSLSNE
ncbi:hypothetical protein VS_2702 [Vibrio atlanticus]|uniref:Uncharacterized protein n=1 Tax=Vibrio atlanticus (strain LGP32) TaxID=575788 RepID=B7VKR8_VIBA3|nr:hypothetical protein VS_2702 [Vibrio atlanticus]